MLVRLALLSFTAVVLAVYVAYLLDNLPSIMLAKESKKTPFNPLGSYIIEENVKESTELRAASGAAQTDSTEPAGAQCDNIWQSMDRSESYNEELQYYSKDNVSFSDGIVTITTKEEKKEGKDYTSGIVTSRYAYLYGTFSFKIKVSEGGGLFPAIWFMPQEDKALPEIDIFEMIGSNAREFYGVVHYYESGEHQKEFFCHEVSKKDSYEVGLKWTKNELSWYIDGQCIFITDKGVPSEPMYLIINQAVGGIWAGVPNEDTLFPATFIIESSSFEPELIVER